MLGTSNFAPAGPWEILIHIGCETRWSLGLTSSVIGGKRYMLGSVIRSFGSKDTERLWCRERVPSLDPRIQRVALRKLRQVGSAVVLDDLRVPPGNRLEPLKGDRAGQYSIRINDQWRIYFVWTDAGPEEVEIVDYH